jgi:hypothetical protein
MTGFGVARRIPEVLLLTASALGFVQRPTFRSAVEYVQLDVVVTDKDDRPVSGLTQNDFEIIEAGRPQTIRLRQ